MPTPEVEALAREVADLKRRLSATERAGRLRRASVQVDGEAVTLQDAATTANSKSTIRYETYEPTNEPNSPGDLWRVRELVGGTVVSEWEGQGGTSWAKRSLGSGAVADTLQGKTIIGSVVSGGQFKTVSNETTGSITIRPGASLTPPGVGLSVIEFFSGNADEQYPAEILALADGPLVTDNTSLLIRSPKKSSGAVRAQIQLFAQDADTTAAAYITGQTTQLRGNTGQLGPAGAPLLEWTSSSVKIIRPARSALSLASGWSNYGSPWETATAQVSAEGHVTLTGLITKGSAATTTAIATLPVGMRPAGGKHFLCYGLAGGQAEGPAKVQVLADGTVQVIHPSGGSVSWSFLSLDGVAFYAA